VARVARSAEALLRVLRRRRGSQREDPSWSEQRSPTARSTSCTCSCTRSPADPGPRRFPRGSRARQADAYGVRVVRERCGLSGLPTAGVEPPVKKPRDTPLLLWTTTSRTPSERRPRRVPQPRAWRRPGARSRLARDLLSRGCGTQLERHPRRRSPSVPGVRTLLPEGIREFLQTLPIARERCPVGIRFRDAAEVPDSPCEPRLPLKITATVIGGTVSETKEVRRRRESVSGRGPTGRR